MPQIGTEVDDTGTDSDWEGDDLFSVSWAVGYIRYIHYLEAASHAQRNVSVLGTAVPTRTVGKADSLGHSIRINESLLYHNLMIMEERSASFLFQLCNQTFETT